MKDDVMTNEHGTEAPQHSDRKGAREAQVVQWVRRNLILRLRLIVRRHLLILHQTLRHVLRDQPAW